MGETRRVSRRSATRVAVVGGTTTAAVVSGASRAEAATYQAVAYRKTRLPGGQERHVANRFGYGWTPSLGRQIVKHGGPDAWFDRQLALGVDDDFYRGSARWWPAINSTTALLWARHEAGTEKLWEAMHDYAAWTLVRRIHSKRQVLEVMTEFWENHLHVPVVGEGYALFRIDYGKGIRARALGRFEDLLQYAIVHPAMGLYLNNASSTKKAPNEDLGRELLELHTVGRGNYTETDVVNSARILTGYRVDAWKTWTVAYDPLSHWTGPVKVMGFSHSNALADGQAVVRAYLKYLAHHPATARRIATKLAQHFVSDTPSAALVERLAAVYLANGTAIKPVLRALRASAEYAASPGVKVRTPEEDVVATYRVLGATIGAPLGDAAAADRMVWQSEALGLAPFGWPRPDGRPTTGDSWASTSRMLSSFSFHYSASGGWYPSENITWRKPASWLPQDSIRMDKFVDHLARTVTGRRSTSALLRACCEATGYGPGQTITRSHGLIRWGMPRLLTTLLDHPNHMTR